MVVMVPAGALRPTSGTPCHRSYEPHSCLELSFSSWQFGEPYGQAKPLMPVLECWQFRKGVLESFAVQVVLTVSSAGAGVGIGKQVSKCEKTCLCTS